MPYFNPRSHERSDVVITVLTTSISISIHAPTRGATRDSLKLLPFSVISIHAPTRGATTFLNIDMMIIDISIHAPTRGATSLTDKAHIVLTISIHAPTRGATSFAVLVLENRVFQSTLPREERPCLFCARYKLHEISIHAPTRGATTPFAIPELKSKISIHAPTRGATTPCKNHRTNNVLFQSTLPREERQKVYLFQCLTIKISIHAPTRGATMQ